MAFQIRRRRFRIGLERKMLLLSHSSLPRMMRTIVHEHSRPSTTLFLGADDQQNRDRSVLFRCAFPIRRRSHPNPAANFLGKSTRQWMPILVTMIIVTKRDVGTTHLPYRCIPRYR